MSNKNTPDPLSDAELEALFAQARDDAPVPSADLLARIANDAAREHAQPVAITPRPHVPWWRRAWVEIGGLPAMGGLVASACAGIYIGLANPDFAMTLWPVETEFETTSDAVLSDPLLGDFVALAEGADT